MHSGILTLPLELLIKIVFYLNFRDFVSLQSVTKELLQALRSESISREIVKRHIFYSKEASLAKQGTITYKAAVKRVSNRREAFAANQPDSALLLGCGSSFIYQDGVLCYLYHDHIRILDVHAPTDVEHIIDLHCINSQIWESYDCYTHVELLHYHNSVLAFSYTLNESDSISRLVAVDTHASTPIAKRILLVVSYPQTSKTFVRHDSCHLFLGLHNGIGQNSHRHEWVLQPYDLSTSLPLPPLQLPNLFGTDIGQVVAFEIHDNHFYAISTQSTYELEEIDWTSYYHCYRFPTHSPSESSLQITRIWRRQHREGPINDSWTDLALHSDDCTGTLLISECRREWLHGLSTQKRTYYTQPLLFPPPNVISDPASSNSTTTSVPSTQLASLPANDRLVRTLDETNKPQYEPPHHRPPCSSHPECSLHTQAPHTFLLAKTKHRAYNPTSAAFLDLVQDNAHLRLRIGSRHPASPLNPTTGLLHLPLVDEATGVAIEGSEEKFIDGGVRMWPAAEAPLELQQLLGAGGGVEVDVASDERSIVWMAGEGNERGIVLVSFDGGMRFGGLRKMGLVAAGLEEDVVLGVEGKGKGRDGGSAGGRVGDGSEGEWFWKERAMWVGLKKGFRF